MNYKSLLIGLVAWGLYVYLTMNTAHAAGAEPERASAVCILEPNGVVWACVILGTEGDAKSVTIPRL